MKIHFGKYKDEEIENVPTEYLTWAIKNLTNMKQALRTEMENEVLKRESQLDILNTFYTEEAHEAGIAGMEYAWYWIDPYKKEGYNRYEII